MLVIDFSNMPDTIKLILLTIIASNDYGIDMNKSNYNNKERTKICRHSSNDSTDMKIESTTSRRTT